MDKNLIQRFDSIHPFPAKYTVEMIEHFILKYTKEGDTVLDPFVGSGTTLLAATINNRIGIGADINPIGYLISKYKITSLSKKQIQKLEDFIKYIKITSDDNINIKQKEITDYESIQHWFKDEIILVLSYIKNTISNYFSTDSNLKDVCFMVFSSIIVNVSKQESDTRYAAIEKRALSQKSVLDLFVKKLKEVIEIAKNDNRDTNILMSSRMYLIDSKIIDKSHTDFVDFIITSPPYPNTYDYYLYHKHRMLWLGYDYKPVMQAEIGSRREFSSLKKPASNFKKDLFEVLKSSNNILKKGSFAMIIIGDGKIKGKLYDCLKITIQIGKRLGWEIVSNEHTLLDNTSRSFSQSFRTKGKKEHYILFKKI